MKDEYTTYSSLKNRGNFIKTIRHHSTGFVYPLRIMLNILQMIVNESHIISDIRNNTDVYNRIEIIVVWLQGISPGNSLFKQYQLSPQSFI